METRTIREHRVTGQVVRVYATSADEARVLGARRVTGTWAWEAAPCAPLAGERVPTGMQVFEVFVARHEDVFALND